MNDDKRFQTLVRRVASQVAGVTITGQMSRTVIEADGTLTLPGTDTFCLATEPGTDGLVVCGHEPRHGGPHSWEVLEPQDFEPWWVGEK